MASIAETALKQERRITVNTPAYVEPSAKEVLTNLLQKKRDMVSHWQGLANKRLRELEEAERLLAVAKKEEEALRAALDAFNAAGKA